MKKSKKNQAIALRREQYIETAALLESIAVYVGI
jgi:hypothetical protein